MESTVSNKNMCTWMDYVENHSTNLFFEIPWTIGIHVKYKVF